MLLRFRGSGGSGQSQLPERLEVRDRDADEAQRAGPVAESPVQERAPEIIRSLEKTYPGAAVALKFTNPLEMLVATILSAQCTDVRVNMVTPTLFKRYPTAADYANADPRELERLIQSTGFFRAKAKSIQECCRRIVQEHHGTLELDSRVGEGTTVRVTLPIRGDENVEHLAPRQ